MVGAGPVPRRKSACRRRGLYPQDTDTRRWRWGLSTLAVDATYLNILTTTRSGPLPDESQDERLRPNNQADGRQRPPELEAHRQVP